MIALDPSQVVEFCLPADVDKQRDRRPTFFGRYLTARQAIRFTELWRKAPEAATLAESVELTMEMLRQGGVYINGPEMGHDLADLLTVNELQELVVAYWKALQPTEADVKKSEPPSPPVSDAK